MRKKKLILWLLPLVIISITQCRHETTEAYNEVGYQRDVTIEHIKDDFDGSSVLIIMDKKTGGINKPHKMDFFGSFEMEYIEDLTEITGDIDSKKYLNKEEFYQILMIKLPTDSKENVLEVIRQLEKVEGILYATPNYYIYPAVAPNDTHYTLGDQWGLNTTYGINAPAAWDITTGSRGILVGILDTGINAAHPDLNKNVLPGRNFEYNNNNTNNTDGHGTQVAGVLGAVGNNNQGTAGVCWEGSMVPLVIGNNDRFLVDRVASAVSFAINNNIGILNFSQGGFDPNANLQVIHSVVQGYYGLFVCAAGNENANINSNTFYYNFSRLNNVIIVGAINSSGNRWTSTYNGYTSGSNYGNTAVHLFAPGGSIISIVNGNGYLFNSGTSLAAPHVTGVAALIKSVLPHLNPQFEAKYIKDIILNNVTVYPALAGLCTTGGRLNAQAALTSLGTVVGFMDIKYNNSGVIETIGRFYLFTNGKWSFVERGFIRNPLGTPTSNAIVNNILVDPMPTAITNFLGNRTINTPVIVLVPANDPLFDFRYVGVTANFTISSNGVTITNPNIVTPVGAGINYFIFKIDNKQGTL